ncbi:hypothetical protein AB0B63_07355 [Micromonospora sp. NPDC049081]|uniref:hypothetical protein n=1 Tax=Micromonospora sp. NPDC049081 TaxID=3155150 RepID=UPI0033E0EB48
MTENPRAAVITWDWRQQPDLNHLAQAINHLSGGTLHLRAANTGSDEYAIVIADTDLDDATTQATYRRWCDDGQDIGEVRRG